MARTISAPRTDKELSRAERARVVREALATIRLEGLEPPSEVISLSDRYIEGELTWKQVGASIDRLFCHA